MVVAIACAVMLVGNTADAVPRPPQSVTVTDHAWDDGTVLDVTVELSRDDVLQRRVGFDILKSEVASYRISRAVEADGEYEEVGLYVLTEEDREAGRFIFEVQECIRNQEYWIRVEAVASPDGVNLLEKVLGFDFWGVESSERTSEESATATRQLFSGDQFWLLVFICIVCGSVVLFVLLARGGRQLYIRKIAGLEAIEEAVGRATEMGRSCLFVPGLQDINEIQTIAGLSLLSKVSKLVAEYDAEISVPTSRSLVMTAARETVEAAFLEAGRPDAYQEDSIYYVTDEQFGYVAHLTGLVVREKPAACFYFGSFFAESLILAETGNAVGAIQVAGTAQPAQLPFFVAACDYTLIGEEFFAASAYLSSDPDQLGSLKGQDVGKIIVGALIIVGVALLTLAEFDVFHGWASAAATYLKDTILSPGK